MEIIGSPKCFVQYRYVTKQPLISESQLLGLGIQEKLKQEFAFSKFDIPKDLSKETLDFKNGRIVVEGHTYSIDDLDIGNVGISTIVWGKTDIAKKIIGKVEEIIEALQPELKLSNARKRINFKSELRVKLDVSAQHFINEKFVSAIKEFADQLKRSDFSSTKVHFPALAAAFVYEPNMEKILSKISPDQIALETEDATRLVKAVFVSPDTDSYEQRVFDATIDADFDTSIAIVKRVEECCKT